MRDEDYEKKEIDLLGRIDVSDELCDDGSEALAIVTDDGEEYVIKNRKMVKRLMKYAYVDDLKIAFHGFSRLDDDGITLFSVVNYSIPEITRNQQELLAVEVDAENSRQQQKKKQKNSEANENVEDEELLPELEDENQGQEFEDGLDADDADLEDLDELSADDMDLLMTDEDA